MTTKADLRIFQKKKRQQLDIKKLSKEIIQNLLKSEEFKTTDSVFTYISFGTEIDTNGILNILNKKIYVPKVSGNKMIMCKYTPENLKKNEYGILEPQNKEEMPPKENDIIIIPALAVDKNFNRLGYGGGYYDRFLKNTNCIKVVLLPEDLFVKEVPVEKWDVAVDIIITEKKIYKK